MQTVRTEEAQSTHHNSQEPDHEQEAWQPSATPDKAEEDENFPLWLHSGG